MFKLDIQADDLNDYIEMCNNYTLEKERLESQIKQLQVS